MSLFGYSFPLRLLIVRTLFILAVVAVFSGIWAVLYRIEAPPRVRAALSPAQIEQRYYYYQTPASNKKIALTFDDGPIEDKTLEIAKVLKENNVTATFFLVGSNVLKHPDVVRTLHDSGFLIGDHSYTHALSIHESHARVTQELNSTAYLIQTITGETPLYYRPPFLLGIGTDPTVNPDIAVPKDVSWVLEAGYIPVGIDIDTYDWALTNSNDILGAFKATLKGGHIVLMHDTNGASEALVDMIQFLKKSGYTFVTVDQLLTPPSAALLTQDFGLGATDATTNGEVSQLQWFLYVKGYLTPYDVTGVFGDETSEALISYQFAHGLVTASALNPHVAGWTESATRSTIANDSIAPEPLPATQQVSSPLYQAWERMVIYSLGNIAWFLFLLVTLSVFLVIIRLGALIPLALTAHAREFVHRTRAQTRLKASVLIPAWNEAENIAGTIKSLFASDYPNLEIFVINDGSTDTTEEIARSVAAEHPHLVRVLSQDNAGKAAALNHGLEESTGDVVIVMDADATFTPTTISELMRHFDDPKIGAVSGKVYPVGKPSLLMFMQTLEYMVGQNVDKRGLGILNALPVVPGPVGAWRKRDVIAVGGFNHETLVEDQDMTLAMLALGRKVLYEPRAIAYTEAPTTVTQFLKQRYRWIFGSYRCFGKYSLILTGLKTLGDKRMRPRFNSVLALVNIFVYGIVLPLTYPLVDLTLVYALFVGSWEQVILPVAIFTMVDMLYAVIALWGEKSALGPVAVIPFVRLFYRQLLLYVVVKSLVTWLEGTKLSWMKLTKTGEAQRHFSASSTS